MVKLAKNSHRKIFFKNGVIFLKKINKMNTTSSFVTHHRVLSHQLNIANLNCQPFSCGFKFWEVNDAVIEDDRFSTCPSSVTRSNLRSGGSGRGASWVLGCWRNRVTAAAMDHPGANEAANAKRLLVTQQVPTPNGQTKWVVNPIGTYQ